LAECKSEFNDGTTEGKEETAQKYVARNMV